MSWVVIRNRNKQRTLRLSGRLLRFIIKIQTKPKTQFWYIITILPRYYGSIICCMVTETRTLEANLLKFDKAFVLSLLVLVVVFLWSKILIAPHHCYWGALLWGWAQRWGHSQNKGPWTRFYCSLGSSLHIDKNENKVKLICFFNWLLFSWSSMIYNRRIENYSDFLPMIIMMVFLHLNFVFSQKNHLFTLRITLRIIWWRYWP